MSSYKYYEDGKDPTSTPPPEDYGEYVDRYADRVYGGPSYVTPEVITSRWGSTDQRLNNTNIKYKYNEANLIDEIKRYIDSTYNQHYSQGDIQSTEIAIDRGRGIGFTLGNVDKYSGRYGLKGTVEDWRKDLMKIIHYAIIALYVHDLEHNNKDEK